MDYDIPPHFAYLYPQIWVPEAPWTQHKFYSFERFRNLHCVDFNGQPNYKKRVTGGEWRRSDEYLKCVLLVLRLLASYNNFLAPVAPFLKSSDLTFLKDSNYHVPPTTLSYVADPPRKSNETSVGIATWYNYNLGSQQHMQKILPDRIIESSKLY